MKRTVLALATLGLAASACGDGTTSVGSGPAPRPTGADEVVFQVLVDGGFVPVEVALNTVPVVTVMGDGTVITGAPVLAIYPGPAIAPLQSVKATAAQVDALLAKAQELGLLSAEVDFGQPPIADAPDTTVTIAAGGTTYRHKANALDLGGLSDEEIPGLTRRQIENRRALSELVEVAQALPPGEDEWVPAEIAVYDIGPHRGGTELPQRPVAWPLAQPPAISAGDGVGFPCTLVEADDVATLLTALNGANALTPWVVLGQPRSLAFRPAVPGQPACPEA